MKPDWEKFSLLIMNHWPEGDVGGYELQDYAVECGLLVEEPDGFDPNRHIDADCVCPERGDPWFLKNYTE